MKNRMYTVSDFFDYAGINIPEVEDLSPIALTTTIILTTLLTFLLISAPTVSGGAVSFFKAFILSGIASLLVAKLVLMRLIDAAREAQKTTQMALAKSEQQADVLSSVLDRLNLQKQVLDQHAFVSEVDVDGNFIYVNDVFCKVSGYSQEELIGNGHGLINIDNNQNELWTEMFETVQKGGIWQGEICNKRKDGSEFWLIQTIAGVTDEAGKLVGYIDFGTEITELKKLQEEMFLKGQLAKLGQLTSTVAHEIRNPLGSVKTSAYLLQKKIEKKGVDIKLDTEFRRINNGIQRCDNIITELLDFSRSKLVNSKSIQIDPWVASIVDEEAENLPDSVEIIRSLELADISADIDKDQMRRVLVNLISNATEAMVGKGDQIVENPTTNPVINISTRLRDSEIEISISDNGPGMTGEIMKKIREPLFTTKSFGVGLGIPAVEKILENHGGGLRIESEVGKGTTMTAWLPKNTSHS